MIGDEIKKYRTEQGLTQQNLADKLFVTAQAVSRWENGEVEPSLGTITKLSEIFGVTPNEMLGVAATATETKPAVETETKADATETKTETAEPEKVIVYKEPKPVLAVCEKCNRPIYNGNEIVRQHISTGRSGGYTRIKCSACDKKEKEEQRRRIVGEAESRRTKSYIWGALSAVAAGLIIILLNNTVTENFGTSASLSSKIFMPIATFTLVSCLILGNNFVGEMIVSIAGFSIRMPGVIFSLDLDGIIWLLTVKLALFLLGLFLTVCCLILAIALGLAVSVVVYPFALAKSIRNPADNDW